MNDGGGKMKTAIVYFSLTGNCRYAAKMAARYLGADLIEIVPENSYPDSGFRKFFWGGKSAVMGDRPKLKPYDFDPEAYGRVIFCFPVWASNVTPPIRTFIEENAASLKDKKIAALLCYSGGGGDKALLKLKKLLGRDELEEAIVVIDPRDRSDAVKDKGIEDFCIRLKKNDRD